MLLPKVVVPFSGAFFSVTEVDVSVFRWPFFGDKSSCYFFSVAFLTFTIIMYIMMKSYISYKG